MLISPPKIGVVILNFNSARDTLACLASLRESTGGDRMIWVVDNGSTDESGRVIPPCLQENEIWLPLGTNCGYAAGNNVGIRQALEWGAEYVLLLNPDATVEPDFLPPMVRALEGMPKAGCACPLILDRETGAIQSLGGSVNLSTGQCQRRYFGRPVEKENGVERWSEVDFPIGACVLFKRAFLEEVGLLKEAYFLYYEDAEIGMRAKREGWVTLAIPHSRAMHRDTTGKGSKNPVVVFHGVRNQAWLVAEYGTFVQHFSFLAASALGRWPLKFLGRLFLGRFRAAWAVAQGSFAGIFSKDWQGGSHLAIPLKGHPINFEVLP